MNHSYPHSDVSYSASKEIVGFRISRAFVAIYAIMLGLLIGAIQPADVAAQGILQSLLGAGKTPAAAEQPDVGIVLFTQDNCPPCKQIQPMVDHLIGQGFPIQKVDVAATPGIAQQWSVTATPTMVVLAEGKEVSRHSGIVTAHQVGKMLIDAGYDADLSVLTKTSATTPLRTMLDRIRPGRRGHRESNDPTASIPRDQWTPAEAAAMAASVRIKVHYQEAGSRITDFGTGTVIHRQGNDMLILTCGHVFRDSQGAAQIEVDFGFDGGDSQYTVPARLLLFDAGAPDVAIVSASTSVPVQPVSIASADYVPAARTKVFTVGCDHGEPATIRRGNYLSTSLCGEAVSMGQQPKGPPACKYDISGRPVVGRSGGGLFTSEGELIGVCNAAVIEENQGVYSSVVNVHDILTKANLDVLFQQTPAVSLAQFEENSLESQDSYNGEIGGNAFGGNAFEHNASAGREQGNAAPEPLAANPAAPPLPKNKFLPAIEGFNPSLVQPASGTTLLAEESTGSTMEEPPTMVTVMIPDAGSPNGLRAVQIRATDEILAQMRQVKQREPRNANSAAVPETHRLPPSAGATMRGQSLR